MLPNIHIHEKLMFERVQERQREIEQRHLLAGQRKPRHSVMSHIIGGLGTWLVALGTKMKQLEQGAQHSVSGGK